MGQKLNKTFTVKVQNTDGRSPTNKYVSSAILNGSNRKYSGEVNAHRTIVK